MYKYCKWHLEKITPWKVSKYGVFFWSKCRKIRIRKNYVFGHFLGSGSLIYLGILYLNWKALPSCNLQQLKLPFNISSSQILFVRTEGVIGVNYFSILLKKTSGMKRVKYVYVFDKFFKYIPAKIYLFNGTSRNTREICEICSKLIIKTT